MADMWYMKQKQDSNNAGLLWHRGVIEDLEKAMYDLKVSK